MTFSIEKREELFSKIDNLRDKVKDIAKIIEEIENRKYDFAYENIERKDEKYRLDEIEVLEKEEIIEDENKNNEEIETVVENIDEVIEGDLSNIDEAIENIEKREDVVGEQEELSDIEYDKEEVKESIEIEPNTNESNIKELTFEDAFGKIDKLIQEAKEINNNVIKFPEEKVVRRNGFRDYEEEKENNGYISYEDAVARRRERLNIEKKEEKKTEKKDIFEEISAKNIENSENIEPVPVLFGNNRAQNQMVVRKKSNGFTDKIKSLIFKIKTMLGGENEKEK